MRTRVTAAALFGHLSIGLTLGLFCALTLIVMNVGMIDTLLAGLEAPRLAVFTFVGGTAALFGCGSTLTGFVLMTIDEN